MAKSKYEWRKENGVCSSCNSPAVKGGKCEDCANRDSANSKSKYEQRKQDGVCTRCGFGKPKEGAFVCDLCAIKKVESNRRAAERRAAANPPKEKKTPIPRKEYQRLREAERKANKICRNCDNPVTDNHRKCDSCRQKDRESKQLLKKDGKCTDCQSINVMPNKSRCNECHKKREEGRKKRYQKAKEDGLCPVCTKINTGGKLCEDCRKVWRTKTKKYRQKLKEEVFNAYGGVVCVCCGIKNINMLELDHINNDGSKNRKELFGKNSCAQFYFTMRKQGFPPGLQVMCASCNKAKHINGVCPHSLLPPEELQMLKDLHAKLHWPTLNNPQT